MPKSVIMPLRCVVRITVPLTRVIRAFCRPMPTAAGTRTRAARHAAASTSSGEKATVAASEPASSSVSRHRAIWKPGRWRRRAERAVPRVRSGVAVSQAEVRQPRKKPATTRAKTHGGTTPGWAVRGARAAAAWVTGPVMCVPITPQ